jgi:molecular chaperone GrpE (heat shock protein)
MPYVSTASADYIAKRLQEASEKFSKRTTVSSLQRDIEALQRAVDTLEKNHKLDREANIDSELLDGLKGIKTRLKYAAAKYGVK